MCVAVYRHLDAHCAVYQGRIRQPGRGGLFRSDRIRAADVVEVQSLTAPSGLKGEMSDLAPRRLDFQVRIRVDFQCPLPSAMDDLAGDAIQPPAQSSGLVARPPKRQYLT